MQEMHGAIMRYNTALVNCIWWNELVTSEFTLIEVPVNLPIKHWLTNVEVYDSVHSFINCKNFYNPTQRLLQQLF